MGANDGKSGDPIHKHVMQFGAHALLIEPQPWLIDEIRSNYRDFGGELVVDNIAVGPESGVLQLHILKRALWDSYIARTGRHPSQIFSPDRRQVLRRIAPRLGLDRAEADAAVEMIEVPMKPLHQVLAGHGFEDLDILQVDCEGWDAKVIASIGDARPAVIHFESFNLSPEDWKAFVSWSKRNDYGFVRGHQDTLAIRGFDQRHAL